MKWILLGLAIACSVLIWGQCGRGTQLTSGVAISPATDILRSGLGHPPNIERFEKEVLGVPISSSGLKRLLPDFYSEAYQNYRNGGNVDWESVAWWRDEPELLEYYLAVLERYLLESPEKIERIREMMRQRNEGVQALEMAIRNTRPKRFPGPDALAWDMSDFLGATDWSAVAISSFLSRQKDHRIEHGLTPIDSPFSTFTNDYFRKHPLFFPPDQALIVLARDKSFRDWPDELLREVHDLAATALVQRIKLKDTNNALEGAFLLASKETGFPVPSAGMAEISGEWAAYQDALLQENSLYLLSLQGILQSYGFETDSTIFY